MPSSQTEGSCHFDRFPPKNRLPDCVIGSPRYIRPFIRRSEFNCRSPLCWSTAKPMASISFSDYILRPQSLLKSPLKSSNVENLVNRRCPGCTPAICESKGQDTD